MFTLFMTALAVLSTFHKTSLWTLVNSKDIYEKHIHVKHMKNMYEKTYYGTCTPF